MWKIDEHLFKDIRRGDEEPTKIGRSTKDLTRGARRGSARGKQNGGVESEVGRRVLAEHDCMQPAWICATMTSRSMQLPDATHISRYHG
jgi:hypothetical protein